MSCIRVFKSGKQGNRSRCEGVAQTQGNGKMIQDRFRSSLSGSSNKFSHLSFALKSNTSSVLEWKFSHHKHQIKNINARYQHCCAMWSSPLGQTHPRAHLELWGTGLIPTCSQAPPRHSRADSVLPRAALLPGWHLQEALPPSCRGHTATGSCYTGLAQLQGLAHRPVPYRCLHGSPKNAE